MAGSPKCTRVSRTSLGYVYDDSAWPVVQFRFTGRLTALENEQSFRDADKLLLAPPGFTCVMDGVAMQMPEVETVLGRGQRDRSGVTARAA